jgi:hypothetical protein
MSKKHTVFHRYLGHIQKAPEHLQQFHALVFSGLVTAVLAAAILYFDYGFWHERYTKDDTLIVENIEQKSDSPVTMFSSLYNEAKEKLLSVKSGGGALLEGKKSYSNKEEFLLSTSTKIGE